MHLSKPSQPSPERLALELIDRGMRLEVRDGAIRCRAVEGAVTREIQSLMCRHKGELLEALTTETSYLPLSPSQRYIWLISEIYRVPYICTIPLRVSGPLQVDRLISALAAVVTRHDILRTYFPLLDGYPVQAIAENVSTAVTLDDLRAHSPDAQREIAACLLRENRRHRFEITTAPLLKSEVLWLEDEEFLWCTTVFHGICDGFSIPVFLQEMLATYIAPGSNAGAVPDVATPYTDYTLRLYAPLPIERKTCADYWKDRIQPATYVLPLPTDHQPETVDPMNGRLAHAILDSAQVKRVAGQSNTTEFAVIVVALDILLYRWTGRRDIAVFIAYNQRSAFGVDASTIGDFVNALPICSSLADDMTGADVLSQVRQAMNDIHNNAALPLLDITTTGRNHGSYFNVFVDMVDIDVTESMAIGDLTVSSVMEEVDADWTLSALSFLITRGGGRFSLYCNYQSALYRPETIEITLRLLRATLDTFETDPLCPLCRFPFDTRMPRGDRPDSVPYPVNIGRPGTRQFAVDFDTAELRRRVRRAFAAVLGRDTVADDVGLFHEGASSLDAARAVWLINKACGVDIPLVWLNTIQTVDQFMAVLMEQNQQEQE